MVWRRRHPSHDGVCGGGGLCQLGGFGHVTSADCAASAAFLKRCLIKPLAEAAKGERRLTALGTHVAVDGVVALRVCREGASASNRALLTAHPPYPTS